MLLLLALETGPFNLTKEKMEDQSPAGCRRVPTITSYPILHALNLHSYLAVQFQHSVTALQLGQASGRASHRARDGGYSFWRFHNACKS